VQIPKKGVTHAENTYGIVKSTPADSYVNPNLAYKKAFPLSKNVRNKPSLSIMMHANIQYEKSRFLISDTFISSSSCKSESEFEDLISVSNYCKLSS
jgi:hypothetical protein